MKTYNVNEINPDFTNADYARQFFPKTIFNHRDVYNLGNGFDIEWLGDGENFIVNHHYYDNDVGYVTDDDIFHGDFGKCIEFVQKQLGRGLD